MFFTGATSPKDNPHEYIASIDNLFHYYERCVAEKSESHCREGDDRRLPNGDAAIFTASMQGQHPLCDGVPLIVNTQGWIKGVGARLLMQLVSRIRPHHVVQLVSQKEGSLDFSDCCSSAILSSAIDETVSPNVVAVTERTHTCLIHLVDAIAASPTAFVLDHLFARSPLLTEDTICFAFSLQVSANERRTLQLTSYFGDPSTFSTYQVPWQRMRIRLMQHDVYPSQVMFALNASVVALAVDKQDLQLSEEARVVTALYCRQTAIAFMPLMTAY